MTGLVTIQNLTRLIELCFLQPVLVSTVFIVIRSHRCFDRVAPSSRRVPAQRQLPEIGLCNMAVRMLDHLREPFHLPDMQRIPPHGLSFATVVLRPGGVCVAAAAVSAAAGMF